MNIKLSERTEIVVDGILLAWMALFLLSYIEFRDLFSLTTTAGGDMASHYFTAQYLRDHLLPQGKITGWCQGNLGGFPMLQNYFPLPFLAMAVLSWVMPLQIAFKLVSISGVFLLPVCTWLFLRWLRQPFPVPVAGAAVSLAFLLNEGNSMWGGNVSSTLAGEFCYGVAFSLSILWLGLLYDRMMGKKNCRMCGVLLALIGLCHGYTLLFDGVVSLFFLGIPGRFRQNLIKLTQMHLLAIFLMGVWLLPLLVFLPYTTRFNILWIFYTLKQVVTEVFPLIFLPFILLNTVHIVWTLTAYRRRRGNVPTPLIFLWYMTACGAGLYAIGYRLGVVDVRFLPFFQFCLILGGIPILAKLRLPSRAGAVVVACVVALATSLWTDSQVHSIRSWSRFNYEGFERKPYRQFFSGINTFLKGTEQDPRVVYEHSLIHDHAGSVRAFESLPLFSGRSTLEGVYIQASLNSPFIYYIQSEISRTPSTPLPDFNYSRFDLARGIAHLNVFNVNDMITAGAKTREAAEKNPLLKFRKRFGPYAVFEIVNAPHRYVEPVRHKPILLPMQDWRKRSYQWFRLGDLSIPVVFKNGVTERDRHRFSIPDRFDPKHLPDEPVENIPSVREVIKDDEILMDGAAVGKPLWIKVSYHPDWKVEGADRIYLASPAFMLIFPTASHVRLYFGKTWPDYLGAGMTCAAIFCLLGAVFFHRRASIWRFRRGYIWSARFIVVGMVAVLVMMGYLLAFHAPGYPTLPYDKGVDFFTGHRYPEARKMFRKVMDDYPQTIVSDDACFLYAMCYYRENDWKNTILSLNLLLETYPETRRAAEAWYHLGICHMKIRDNDNARACFEETIRNFPDEIWAQYARDRLKEFPQ